MSRLGEPRARRVDPLITYLAAVPGMCVLASLSRRLAAGARTVAGTGPGLRTGPIRADIGAPAATDYAMMTTFEGETGVRLDEGVLIREFATPVSLPLGIKRVVRTREEIRLVPPDTIEFRHLAGPVRGMAEVIVVEPQGAARCRVTYTGVLPHSSPVLRVAYRLLARPAIERIVRTHVADLARQAGGEEPGRSEDPGHPAPSAREARRVTR